MTGSLLLLNLLAQVSKACFALFAGTEAKNEHTSLKNSTDPSSASASFPNYVRVIIILQYQAYDVLSEKDIVVRSFHSYQRASKGDFIFWENLNAYYQKSEQ